jgi:hypothetical protein
MSVSPYLSLSLSLCLYVSVSTQFSLSLCLTVSQSFSLSLPVSQSFSLSLSVSSSLSISLCVSVSQSFTLSLDWYNTSTMAATTNTKNKMCQYFGQHYLGTTNQAGTDSLGLQLGVTYAHTHTHANPPPQTVSEIQWAHRLQNWPLAPRGSKTVVVVPCLEAHTVTLWLYCCDEPVLFGTFTPISDMCGHMNVFSTCQAFSVIEINIENPDRNIKTVNKIAATIHHYYMHWRHARYFLHWQVQSLKKLLIMERNVLMVCEAVH